MAALDGGDEPALLATLHFAHYRLAADKMRMWDQPGAYLGDFFARAGRDWHHSGWDFRKVIAAGAAKVHLDVQFTRYRANKLGDRLLSLVVDRHQGRRTLGRRGAVELRGLVCMIGGLPEVQFQGGRMSSGGCRTTVRRPRL